MAVDALQKGAFDFLEKPFNGDALVSRVQRALAQEDAHHSQHTEHLQEADRLASLSGRERAVMHLVAAGKLNKVIADELCVSVRTVEVHRARVFAKLGVRSSAEVATLLTRLGLGDEPQRGHKG
jgi:two-component system response regulator DctR